MFKYCVELMNEASLFTLSSTLSCCDALEATSLSLCFLLSERLSGVCNYGFAQLSSFIKAPFSIAWIFLICDSQFQGLF
jgi:hypothetical protein